MTTIRVARRKHWTVIAQETVNDERLSFRARGVLIWLLDKPDDWRIERDAIARAGTEGEKAIRAALHELTTLGYIVHRRVRDRATGRISTTSTVYECPDCTDEEPADTGGRFQATGPVAGFRPAGSPPSRKQAALPKTKTKHSDQSRALTSSDHQLGYAANGDLEDDQDPPAWIGGPR